MGSHRLREKPDLGDFKAPRTEPRSKPREPKPASPGKSSAELVTQVVDTAGATPFELSRIYAKGWQAGMQSASEDPEFDSATTGESLNPCRAINERARWMQGFNEAVARKRNSPGRKAIGFRLSTV